MIKKEDFQQVEKLYHYTSMFNAFQILASGILYFSHLSKSNDINEKFRTLFDDDYIDLEAAEKEFSRYNQLSFSIDTPHPGFAIPTMWGHYADKGNGACLVFNKEKILSHYPKETFNYCEEVKYRGLHPNHDNSIIIEKSKVENLFRRRYKSIFFKKTLEWKYEQELKLVHKGTTENIPYSIPIRDALVAVIVTHFSDVEYKDSEFSSKQYTALRKLIPDTPILILSKFLKDMVLTDEYGNDWLKCGTLQVKS